MKLKHKKDCWWFKDQINGKPIYSQHFKSKKYALEAKKDYGKEVDLLIWGYNNKCSGCGSV
jgi:hypothetical protein